MRPRLGPDRFAGPTAGLRDALRDDAGARTDPEVMLSDREIDVLARLERQTDKQIAEALKLSFHDVRYRVRSIFAKLGAYGRREAPCRQRRKRRRRATPLRRRSAHPVLRCEPSNIRAARAKRSPIVSVCRRNRCPRRARHWRAKSAFNASQLATRGTGTKKFRRA